MPYDLKKDAQKRMVYLWEDQYVAPKIGHLVITPIKANAIVAFIWKTLGRVNPPKIYFHGKIGDNALGSRYELIIPPNMENEHILIHELAHALNGSHDRAVYDAMAQIMLLIIVRYCAVSTGLILLKCCIPKKHILLT